jgi:peptidylprolyl isomerase
MNSQQKATFPPPVRLKLGSAGGADHEYGNKRSLGSASHGFVHGRDAETEPFDRLAHATSAETCGRSREYRPSGLRDGYHAFGGLIGRVPTALLLGALIGGGLARPATADPSLAEIVAASPSSDWRSLDPRTTLYLDIPAGRVIIELAPRFAPNHVANIERLARAHFFDDLFIVRSQDNYVVQWGDAEAKRPLGGAKLALKAEFSHHFSASEPISKLPDPDTYAPVVGFTDGFPAAHDPATGEAWLTHCYGMVGAGRDNDADSGSGAELYAVIGQAPRQLDRNVTLVGRVVRGMELLSVAPRGTADLGFYKTAAERIPITRMVVAADLPAADRVPLEALRTDSATFAAVIHNRRFRRDAFYKRPAGAIDVCNVPLPIRDAPKP